MNKKVMREINSKVEVLLITWIQSILSEEEAAKVTKELNDITIGDLEWLLKRLNLNNQSNML